ncbi:MAG: phosphatidate cytidylyltransferase, partial [Thermodesulfobacteriota bacterium]|nr:phosphatidate cytidylyltransferase [Thermodesulfobacteriota bacterium]
MHLKRWITGVVAFPILVFLVGFGPRWSFYSLLYAASLFGLLEFYAMTAPDLPRIFRWSSYLLTFLLFFATYLGQVSFVPVVIVFLAFIPMTFYVFIRRQPNRQDLACVGKAVFGPVYVGLPLTFLLYIDRFYPDEGNIWIFFLLVVVFANDTGAFYFGRLLGKHKLHEVISPGKTWEGAIGGLLSSMAAAVLFLHIIDVHHINLSILILVLALSVSGQVGDLAESMLKRSYNVKDSGRILPGHGGILDRIDGLLFSIPIMYVYLFHFT